MVAGLRVAGGVGAGGCRVDPSDPVAGASVLWVLGGAGVLFRT